MQRKNRLAFLSQTMTVSQSNYNILNATGTTDEELYFQMVAFVTTRDHKSRLNKRVYYFFRTPLV